MTSLSEYVLCVNGAAAILVKGIEGLTSDNLCRANE
jgi:hypothetical protein